jgi:hypothetical protein|tara:strand:+ start:13 stop:354 length:342 start_codon:yes stop_codon:yes gene_type:complete
MSTNKLYTVAGTSTFNGKTKVRFANDYVSRFKILTKNGHDNIEIMELDTAMSKADVCKFLSTHEKFQSEAQQSAIAEFVVRNISVDTAPATAEAEIQVEIEEPTAPVTETETA